MDGLLTSVGNGLTGLVGGAFAAIGQALRGIVDALSRALPGALLPAVIFVVLLVVAWQLIKR
ncbi:MAG TPA: hypothetical protein VFK35_03660 [Candidatus Limnocylindrales bacterium]|nr:hypothetical protein [Candidatus Limnocylindrales bacterium]